MGFVTKFLDMVLGDSIHRGGFTPTHNCGDFVEMMTEQTPPIAGDIKTFAECPECGRTYRITGHRTARQIVSIQKEEIYGPSARWVQKVIQEATREESK